MTAIVRPNGKVYRPRFGPVVDVFYDWDDYTCVIVQRTHDVMEARLLAAALLKEYDLTDVEPQRVWWRLVPWGGQYERTWVTDEKRGTPAVVFQYGH